MNEHEKFPGFKPNYSKGYFKYPIEMESYWHLLTGSEQKVLDFILRQTIGFQKMEDEISLSQFVGGIGKKNKGSGVSRSQIQRCLVSLQEKDFIEVKYRKFKTNLIKLVLDEDDDSVIGDYEDESVDEFIQMFEHISPHRVDEFLKSKAQRNAITNLLTHYSEEELEECLQKVIQYKGEPYFPVIATPVDLGNKIASFLLCLNRSENS